MKEKIIAEMKQELINWAIKKDLCFSFETMRQHAEVLYNAGYRKVPEGGCVLSKEENENWVEWLEQNVKQARKETAEKILNDIACMITCWDGRNVHINHDELVEFGNKYGVDMRVVEE